MITATLDELMLLVSTARGLLRRAWLPALVSMVVYGLIGLFFSFVAAFLFCFLSHLGWSSVELAFLAVGPIAAFGAAARGETPTVRSVLTEARGGVFKLATVYLQFSLWITLPFWVLIPVGLSIEIRHGVEPWHWVALASFGVLWALAMLTLAARHVVIAAPLAVLEREIFPQRWFPLRSERVTELARGRLPVLAAVKLCPLAIIIGAIPDLLPRTLVAQVSPALLGLEGIVFLGALFAAAFAHALLVTSVWAIATGRANALEQG
jgi:hypothetical protein